MSLAGTDPADPTPAVRREFIFGAGPPSATASSRPVVLIGNKTSSGTETVDTLGDPIADDADCRTRFGERSEVYAMWRKFTAIPQTCTIYGIAATESTGSAATITWTVVDTSDAVTTYKIEAGGHVAYYTAGDTDTAQTTAEGVAAIIDDMDEGRLMLSTATSAGSDHDLDITAIHKGPRLDNYVENVRITALQSNNTQTASFGALTGGATEDDHTSAIAALADAEVYYHVTAKTATEGPTAADNGLGEHMTMITNQGTPTNGKDQRLVYAMVGTNAEAITVPVASVMNSAFGTCLWSEDHDWSTGELAAHYAAVIRSEEIRHPSANINDWTNDPATGKIWLAPPPNDDNDAPTAAEIVSALNNGVTPMGVRNGRSYIVRHITNRSLNSASANDYTAREGHIPSADHFAWNVARQFYEARRQPFADYDPQGTQPPPAATQTPKMLKGMLNKITDDLSSNAPMSGAYRGPILAPSAAETDKANTQVTYDGKGGFRAYWPVTPVQHALKWDVEIADQSAAY